MILAANGAFCRRSGLEPAALRQRSLQELCAANVAPLLTGSVATLRSDLVGVHQVDGAIPLTLTRLPATAGPGTAWCLLELLDQRVNLADLDGLVRGLLASLESPTTTATNPSVLPMPAVIESITCCGGMPAASPTQIATASRATNGWIRSHITAATSAATPAATIRTSCQDAIRLSCEIAADPPTAADGSVP